MYADYEFYKNNYRGNKVSETDFSYYANKAQAELDYLTNYNINADALMTFDYMIGMAMCEVIDILHGLDHYEDVRTVQSVSSGGESYTFANVLNGMDKAYTDENLKHSHIMKKIRPYLSGTGLLYQGV